MADELSHVDEAGRVRMVDVGAKPESRRRAVARAVVRMAPETAERLRDLPKGDALTTAELAGVMAAKRTSELIPLCHQLPLSVVRVVAEVGFVGRLRGSVVARAVGGHARGLRDRYWLRASRTREGSTTLP